MGHLFRSEEVELFELIVSAEASYDTVSELGEVGVCQFNDLNKDVSMFQRQYANEVRRCDEMERHIRYFSQQIERTGIPVPISVADREWGVRPTPQDMDLLESKFHELDQEVREINSNEETLQRNYLELTEMRHILRKTADFFQEAQSYTGGIGGESSNVGGQDEDSDAYRLLKDDVEAQVTQRRGFNLGFLTGVIRRDKVIPFERVLWRATRGNAFLRKADIEESLRDPATGDSVDKTVFLVFFQGEQLEIKARKISEGFGATVYPCPESAQQRRELSIQVNTRLDELQSVLDRTLDHRRRVLNTVAVQLDAWSVKVKKIKAIFHTLNLFNLDVTRKCMVAEIWVPKTDIECVRTALHDATERAEIGVQSILARKVTKRKPPTFHRTNKVTEGFQTIVDAYGVATYREANPALFTVITFPFLFGVMFGDIGHGTLMALAAGYLVYKERKFAKLDAGEIFEMMFGGRYIILMMGIFSIYTGFVYNDMFSKSLNLFGSGWPSITVPSVEASNGIDFIPEDFYANGGSPYIFGIDPYWALAENKLTFLNSFKMKTSVILGVTHMMFGVVVGVFNHMFFKDKLSIYFEFIPQVLFLAAIFGYLCFLIFYKWAVNWTGIPAPSLLITLIDMFLKPGKVAPDNAVFGQGVGQGHFQTFLVLLAVACVPWMLCCKPCILKNRYKKKMAQRTGTYNAFRGNGNSSDAGRHLLAESEDDDESPMLSPARPVEVKGAVEMVESDRESTRHEESDDDDEHFEFGEIMVHQCIHTIEYCLGCISNTASYLRLWALSLAHAELSEVLWSMVLQFGLKGNVVVLFFAWGFWALLTIAVLLIMEGLSAFLHALRLHWVEFQNKFYDGSGIKFKPFAFKAILSGKGQDD